MAGGLAEVAFGDASRAVNIVRQASERTSTTLLSEWKRLRRVSGVPGATETTGRVGAEPTGMDAWIANTPCESNCGRFEIASNRFNTDKINILNVRVSSSLEPAILQVAKNA
jgi:hypothetical protein